METMASRNTKGFPPRLCSLCRAKIRFQDRLCPVCVTEWKGELVFDDKTGAWKVGDLTPAWLRGIIQYDSYSYNVELRDVGKVIPLEGVKNKV
jgi:hypothetical protein